MSKIADKHGLTNKYRPVGSKRVVKRGRPRKYLLGYRKPRSSRTSNTYGNATAMPEVSTGSVVFMVSLIVLLAVIVVSSTQNNSTAESIGYIELVQEGHPILYDDYDLVKDYYKEYENVSVGSFQVHPEVDKPVVTALTYLNYDTIYLITLNLNNIDRVFSLKEAINIALDYIPAEIILECFDFEKSIYKCNTDGTKQYECYYTQKETGVEEPGYYIKDDLWIKLQYGFSLVIKETINGSYIIEIGDDWYDNVYDPKPIGGGAGPSEEEMASHINWDFSLEKYILSQE